MDDLYSIYETLREIGLCKSQRDFSKDFLGKSSGYLSQITNTGAIPAISAIGMLVGILHAVVVQGESMPDLWVERRKLRSAWVAASVILQRERHRQRCPSRTAASLPPLLNEDRA